MIPTARRTVNNSSIETVYRPSPALHCVSACQNMLNLQKRDKLCDITVRLAEKEYFVHKVILAAASQDFADLLDGEERNVVALDDVSPAVFEMILEYAYSGNVVITSDNVVDLFDASKILRMITLEAACCEALHVVITASNCCKMKVVAGQHGSAEIYEICQAYAFKHFKEITETGAFLELPLDEMKKLVTDRRAGTFSGEEMSSAVLKWMNHDLENRQQHLFEFTKDVPKIIKEILYANFLVETTGIRAGIESEPIGSASRGHLKRRLPSYIFATGGISDGGSQLSACELYNSRTNEWHRIAPMHSKRSAHAVINVNQLLYAFGGCNNDQKELASVEYYDSMKNAWTWTTPLPHERRGHGICSLYGYVYICGGKNKNCDNLSTVEQFDPSTAVYKACAAMSTKRAYFKMAAVDGCIYAIGGQNTHVLDTVERFDPRQGRWSAVPSLNRKRSGLGVAVFNGYIYCTGGFDDGSMASGERFDFRRNIWEPIPNMICGRHDHNLVLLDDCICAIGGRDLNSAEKFDPRTNRWTEMPPMLQRRWLFGAWA